MEKEFVPYEQALKLKELGFDEPCFAIIHKGGSLKPQLREILIKNTELVDYFITSPTFSQAFRWFRDKYPELNPARNLLFILDKTAQSQNQMTYEEAELECLKKLIEIVKEKQL